jgi:hypothetical protein
MNDEPKIDEEAIAETDPRVDLEPAPSCKRTNTLLMALGAGLAIGLIVRALRPEPTRTERLAHLLADLEERMRDTARPALRRATSYASDGAEVVREGLHTGEALLQRCWRDTARCVRNLFS